MIERYAGKKWLIVRAVDRSIFTGKSVIHARTCMNFDGYYYFFPVKPMAMNCGSCHILIVKFCDVQMYMQSLEWADDDIAQYFTIYCDAACKSHWKQTAWFVWLFLLHKWYRQPNGGAGRESWMGNSRAHTEKRKQKVHTEEEVSEGNDSIVKYFCNTDFASLGSFSKRKSKN